uniref:Uncharacterized protein n=1 Tax=Arundo donax TaxID=35708 RepID=A0A0A9BPG8_ARUDO
MQANRFLIPCQESKNLLLRCTFTCSVVPLKSGTKFPPSRKQVLGLVTSISNSASWKAHIDNTVLLGRFYLICKTAILHLPNCNRSRLV